MKKSQCNLDEFLKANSYFEEANTTKVLYKAIKDPDTYRDIMKEMGMTEDKFLLPEELAKLRKSNDTIAREMKDLVKDISPQNLELPSAMSKSLPKLQKIISTKSRKQYGMTKARRVADEAFYKDLAKEMQEKISPIGKPKDQHQH